MRRKSSESKMPTTFEAHRALIDLAGEGRPKDRLNRAYAALRSALSFNRVRDIFYADSRISIWQWELDAINEALAKKRRAKIIQADNEANDARKEYAELRDRIARLEAALALSAPDFHREALDALRSAGDARNRRDG